MSRQQKEFYDALSSHRDKIAQTTDASVAFITMKKHAGIMGAAKGIGTKALGMAKANPMAAGAAVGAAGGAVAGGPNHRLSGAAAGGAVGAVAGRAVGKMPGGAIHRAEDAANASQVRDLGQHAMGTAPMKEPGAATQLRQLSHSPTAPAIPQGPAGGGMGGVIPWKEGTPAIYGKPAPAGMAGGVVPHSAYKSGRGNEFAGLSASNVPPALMPQQSAPAMARGTPSPAQGRGDQTMVMAKKASLPPFVVAADSSNAASSGGSVASIKTANMLGDVALSSSEHTSGFRIPGMSALIGILDDAALIGRQKLQTSISHHSAQQKEKQASPLDETPIFDMKQRAADRFPERVSPIEAIRTDFKSALKLLADKVHDLRSGRAEIAQPKIAMQKILHYNIPLNANEFRAHREKIASEVGLDLKEMAALGGMPKQLMTPRGAGFAGMGALIGGGLGYLGSRGKPELGGRSRAEVDLQNAKARQPEKPEGIGPTIGKHVVNIHADVAEQMRKHPVAATFAGAGVGAGLALRVASMLGK